MKEGTAGDEYIIGGEPTTLVELFDIISDIADREPPRAISPAVFNGLARIASALERIVTLPDDYRAERLRILAGVTYLGDNSIARSELGLKHRPLREGLEETVKHELERL